MRGKQDDCSTICKKIVQAGRPVFLRAIFQKYKEENGGESKDEEKQRKNTSNSKYIINNDFNCRKFNLY